MKPTEPQYPLGTVIADSFVIRAFVAHGGMGAVYEAEQLASGVRGALKLMLPKYAVYPLAVERFAREAVAASRIAHGNIVKVLDAGRLETGEPYLFMELLSGEPLASRIARQGRLELGEVANVVRQAAAGLMAAHAAGIVHRDVKPENLFLVAGQPLLVKVLDFGISKFVSGDLQALTKQGLPMGTFRYMPPEQMLGAERVDERADVYSIGVVLYEALVGRPPFVASGMPALLSLMHRGAYQALSALRPELSPLDPLLARCLAADPERRFASMREFDAALVEVLRTELGARLNEQVG